MSLAATSTKSGLKSERDLEICEHSEPVNKLSCEQNAGWNDAVDENFNGAIGSFTLTVRKCRLLRLAAGMACLGGLERAELLVRCCGPNGDG